MTLLRYARHVHLQSRETLVLKKNENRDECDDMTVRLKEISISAHTYVQLVVNDMFDMLAIQTWVYVCSRNPISQNFNSIARMCVRTLVYVASITNIQKSTNQDHAFLKSGSFERPSSLQLSYAEHASPRSDRFQTEFFSPPSHSYISISGCSHHYFLHCSTAK